MSEVQEVIYEVVEELRKMTAPEIKKFQKKWLEELERRYCSPESVKLCMDVIDFVLEEKGGIKA